MSSSGDSSGYSCADCYFRQELVCALRTQEICPTFRLGLQPAAKIEPPARMTLVDHAQVQAAATARVASPTQAPVRVAAAQRAQAAATATIPAHGTLPLVETDDPATPTPHPSRSRIAERVARRFPVTVVS